MLFAPWYERIGSLYQTKDLTRSRTEALILLDESFRVLGLITDRGIKLPQPMIGAQFFDLFPTPKSERTLLQHMLSSCLPTSLLMHAGNHPVMMLCSFFGRTRLLVAAIPHKRIAELLLFPAAYNGALEHVTLSDMVLRRIGSADDEAHALLVDWCKWLNTALFEGNDFSSDYRVLPSLLIGRTLHLARLCECSVTYDFTGLENRPLPRFDLSAFIGKLFALFIAANRTAKDHTLELRCEVNANGNGVLHAFFDPLDPKDPLPELTPLMDHARLCGERFEIAPLPAAPTRLHVCYSFCPKEISFQGVKDRLNDNDRAGHFIAQQDITPAALAPRPTPGVPLSALMPEADGEKI